MTDASIKRWTFQPEMAGNNLAWNSHVARCRLEHEIALSIAKNHDTERHGGPHSKHGAAHTGTQVSWRVPKGAAGPICTSHISQAGCVQGSQGGSGHLLHECS